MNWGFLTTVFLLSTVKFMFAPASGSAMGLPFWETYIASVAGGSFGAAIFYFSSEWFIKYTHAKKVKKREELEKQGLPVPHKNIFTKTNRMIIRIKGKLGIYGICFWAPFFLSVPLGSIIVAKFYGKLKKTFPLIVLGMGINAFITCGLSYLHILF
jgi:hypothetical protein